LQRQVRLEDGGDHVAHSRSRIVSTTSLFRSCDGEGFVDAVALPHWVAVGTAASTDQAGEFAFERLADELAREAGRPSEPSSCEPAPRSLIDSSRKLKGHSLSGQCTAYRHCSSPGMTAGIQGAPGRDPQSE
jgi:hypothetical protein